jgi:hypothetical protein
MEEVKAGYAYVIPSHRKKALAILLLNIICV